jgi:hypothetical protein
MAGSGPLTSYWTPGLSTYLLRHPSSISTLARAAWRLRRTGWWRRAPFLPLPDREYWKFRIATAAGAGTTALEPAAVLDAARWALRQPAGR